MNNKYGMIGLIAIGLCLIISVNRFKSYDRVVSVRGLCEREVPADKVTWPLVYKIVGNNLNDIFNEINQKNLVVKNFLKNNGISEQEISVGAPSVIDMTADRYSDQNRLYRYNVTSVITVVSKDVEKVAALINKQGDLLSSGVALVSNDYEYRTVYEFTGLNNIKPQMIEEATANAREAANKFAADSKSRIGKIKTAYQGQFSVTDRDNYTPNIKNVRVVTSIEFYLK